MGNPISEKHAIDAISFIVVLGLSQTEHIQPPTFAQTDQYSAPTRILLSEGKGALPGYQTAASQDSVISKYLYHYPASRNFLREVATIIDDIYGIGVARNIHVVDDIDTEKPIMELTIQSGLPVDDEFIQKDQLLFQRIDASGLAWGLRDVVISQG